MTTSNELSCFDCPLVCEIGNLLERSNAVRDEAVVRSIQSMSEFELTKDMDADNVAMGLPWQNTSEEIFSLLDSADKKLIDSRIALLETCEAHQPIYVDAQSENKGSTLRCSSALAEQVMRMLDMKNE